MSSEEQTPDAIDIHQVIAIMIDQVAAIGWQKLGLQPDPLSGKMAQDLTQAKVAIDVVADLAKYLEGKLDDQDQRQIHNLVSDLRINYVQRTSN
ncbi:DUF1844 domain-containing protein [Kamptonema cortianum]|nr:DUF1844 domain-containing protein [Geitlerinema splendidum]MDK3155209.1 DUF1844 domain-containing protein [Kamptonema cortianum]